MIAAQFIRQIAVSLVNGRPSASNFTYSPELQEWTKATNVRLRLIQTQTLFGHLMAVRVDQDPTVTRRVSLSVLLEYSYRKKSWTLTRYFATALLCTKGIPTKVLSRVSFK